MDKYGFLLEYDRRGSSGSVGESRDGDASGVASGAGGSDPARSPRPDPGERWENILDKAPPGGRPPSRQLRSSSADLYSVSQSKVKYYARRGLPDHLRRKAWTGLTGVDLLMREKPGEYDGLVGRAEEEWTRSRDLEGSAEEPGKIRDSSANMPAGSTPADVFICDAIAGSGRGESGEAEEGGGRAGAVLETIERDINRTFPTHYLFHSAHDEEDGECGENGSSFLGGSYRSSEGSCDPENLGSDDEGEEDISAAGDADTIVEAAKSTGQDTAQFMQAKKRLFDEEAKKTLLNESTGGMSHDISWGGLHNDGIGHGQGALRRVLRAYSIYDPEVGYCQGMNFIAAMFLTFLSEDEAFWLLVVVMNEEPYKLRDLFGEDMAGTQEMLYIAEKLLAQFLPKLAKHMEQESVHVSMFVTPWLLTVYTSVFPFDLVVRVWDCFLVEGWKVVYRVMLSLFEHASEELLNRRFEEILSYFRDYPPRVDGQVIVAGSLRIALKRTHIQRHVNEWRRHAGRGKGRSKSSSSRQIKRRSSAESSASTNSLDPFPWASLPSRTAHTENGAGRDGKHTGPTTAASMVGEQRVQGRTPKRGFPKMAPPKSFLKKSVAVPREIVIESLTEKLLPIVGTSKFAVLLHNVLTPRECSELINRAEGDGFEDASIHDDGADRMHRNCAWHVEDDPSLADAWYERIVHALRNTTLEKKLITAPWAGAGDGTSSTRRASGLDERIRLLRYGKGQFFRPHSDAASVRGPNRCDGTVELSFASVHVYLNQKFKGGNTTFHGAGRHLDVKPRTGSVLLFEHGMLHEGQVVTQGKKYVVRTDVMYADARDGVGLATAASGTALTQQL